MVLNQCSGANTKILVEGFIAKEFENEKITNQYTTRLQTALTTNLSHIAQSLNLVLFLGVSCFQCAQVMTRFFLLSKMSNFAATTYKASWIWARDEKTPKHKRHFLRKIFNIFKICFLVSDQNFVWCCIKHRKLLFHNERKKKSQQEFITCVEK